MRRLFIYYRVLPERAGETLVALQALQQQACARFAGLQAELLRRPEEKDGLQTWMETYSHPDGVPASAESWLCDEALRAGVLGIQGNMYVEVFVPCAS
ncbi:DUF4936 family protein [Caldimonas tepidiphila]|uniref:DUF4936 family protein n=1 Tax=Caldimonas tepidiphila TaxID=2315841 RepID=UPI000E5C2307|nr:DUF4936 family protein [Caldimonas tepidiphila]